MEYSLSRLQKYWAHRTTRTYLYRSCGHLTHAENKHMSEMVTNVSKCYIIKKKRHSGVVYVSHFKIDKMYLEKTLTKACSSEFIFSNHYFSLPHSIV